MNLLQRQACSTRQLARWHEALYLLHALRAEPFQLKALATTTSIDSAELVERDGAWRDDRGHE